MPCLNSNKTAKLLSLLFIDITCLDTIIGWFDKGIGWLDDFEVAVYRGGCYCWVRLENRMELLWVEQEIKWDCL